VRRHAVQRVIIRTLAAKMRDDQPVERRRTDHTNQPPMTVLRQLPALVVLERLPVPVLAVTADGTILFTNTAFAGMVGRDAEEVLSLKFGQIFAGELAAEPLDVVHALANMVVALAHRDGSIVRALMSRSAFMRSDDRIALATFQDLTEQLWLDER
jgi:PAS domain S-box-containing protein